MALKSKKQKQFPETTIPLHRLLKFFECNCLSVFQTCNDTKQTRFRKLQTFSLLTNWQIGYKWPLTHNVSPFFQLRKYSTLNRDNFYLFHIHLLKSVKRTGHNETKIAKIIRHPKPLVLGFQSIFISKCPSHVIIRAYLQKRTSSERISLFYPHLWEEYTFQTEPSK